MKLRHSQIWTGAFHRLSHAAAGSSWTGWSLWLEDEELEHFAELIARRGEYPEAEALRAEIQRAIEERRR